MSSTEENKDVIRRYRQELMNEGNLNVVDAIFPARFALNGQEMTPESFKPLAAMWRTAFPDLHYTLEHIIAEGDIVVEHWTARGTHRGRLFGIAPTDKHFENTGINIHHIVDGKIVEIWEVADGLGLLQQLGVVQSWEKLADQGVTTILKSAPNVYLTLPHPPSRTHEASMRQRDVHGMATTRW